VGEGAAARQFATLATVAKPGLTVRFAAGEIGRGARLAPEAPNEGKASIGRAAFANVSTEAEYGSISATGWRTSDQRASRMDRMRGRRADVRVFLQGPARRCAPRLPKRTGCELVRERERAQNSGNTAASDANWASRPRIPMWSDRYDARSRLGADIFEVQEEIHATAVLDSG